MVPRRSLANAIVLAAVLSPFLGYVPHAILGDSAFAWHGKQRPPSSFRPSSFAAVRRTHVAKVSLQYSGDFQVGRRIPGFLLVAETLGIVMAWDKPSAFAENEASMGDVELLQGALSSVRKIGDFPSKSALADADAQLTAALARWQERKDAVLPSEVSAILRKRADVRLQIGSVDGALKDLGDALQLCQKSMNYSSVKYEEMPNVLMTRAEVLSTQDKWDQALKDFDLAAELLGEPLEDVDSCKARIESDGRSCC